MQSEDSEMHHENDHNLINTPKLLGLVTEPYCPPFHQYYAWPLDCMLAEEAQSFNSAFANFANQNFLSTPKFEITSKNISLTFQLHLKGTRFLYKWSRIAAKAIKFKNSQIGP